MAKTTLITVLALVASVATEPYMYGASIYAPSPALPAAYANLPATLPASYPAGLPAALAAAYPATYPAAYTGAYPAAYTGAYPATYPLSALAGLGASAYSVEEFASLVNPAPAPIAAPLPSPLAAPLVYAPPYAYTAGYVYKR